MAQISAITFDFLKDLKANNVKTWFDENRKRYEAALQEMINFTEMLIHEISSFDEIDNESGKKSLYRIYRDIRFSKDKTPYKTHFSGSLRRSGALRRGGFYFHIEPGNTHIGGGFWGPNKEDLLRLREHLAQDADPLIEVVSGEAFKTYFGALQGAQLKTAPKGFDKNHPNIYYLRFKQFLVGHSFEDQEVLSPDFVKTIAQGYSNMLPFFGVMTGYLTTNLNGEELF